LGPTALGFRHRDDVKEIRGLLEELGIKVNVVAPLEACVADIRRLPEADFNVVLYPELGRTAAQWLQRSCAQPFTQCIPYGVNGTLDFIAEVQQLAGMADPTQSREDFMRSSRARWYAKSVDSTYLTGKRVFVFGDATHAIAAARVAHQEMGFEVVGLGTYSREFAREVRDAAKLYGIEALITDDYLEVEDQVKALQPELLLGTQMERHIAKRLGVPCTVISAPMHVQDFPARYAPQMGFEGANVLFDTWVHPLMMGLEEHLLGMFREDFEFHDGAAPSHLGSGHGAPAKSMVLPLTPSNNAEQIHLAQDNGTANGSAAASTDWAPEAEKELKKIPFFVRGKARRNTELFARERGVSQITVETMYEAKAHFSR
jgi:light-independent protochlorophyllide reductase subunit B